MKISVGMVRLRWPLSAATTGAVVVVAECMIGSGGSAPPAGSHHVIGLHTEAGDVSPRRQ
jgi:hypothetical protein